MDPRARAPRKDNRAVLGTVVSRHPCTPSPRDHALLIRDLRARHATTVDRPVVAFLELVQGSVQHGALARSRLRLPADDVLVVHGRAALVAGSVVALADRRFGDRADDRSLAGERPPPACTTTSRVSYGPET